MNLDDCADYKDCESCNEEVKEGYYHVYTSSMECFFCNLTCLGDFLSDCAEDDEQGVGSNYPWSIRHLSEQLYKANTP